MSEPLKPRWGHTITAFSLRPGLTEVTAFGGTALPWKGGEDKQPKLAETTLLQFGASIHSYILAHSAVHIILLLLYLNMFQSK